MCGRFTKTKDQKETELREYVSPDRVFANLEPRYNIAPSQKIAVLRVSESGHNELVDLVWGFVPHWLKKEALQKSPPAPINARSEEVERKPYFRSAFQKSRCLIPADGFFEWKSNGKQKQPYYIRMKDRGLFFFAGLWDHSPGSIAGTCTILTTSPNSLCAAVHNRMPVIIPGANVKTWLAPSAQLAELKALLVPYDSDRMECFEVSTYVNSPRNSGPESVSPLSENL